jgi:polygalacturonase
MHLQFCDGVLLDTVHMFNPNTPSYEAPNGDGVDIGSSRNVVIRNSVLDMSDDHVCVRAGQGHAAAVQSAGFGVGEGRCGTHSILVEDSEVCHQQKLPSSPTLDLGLTTRQVRPYDRKWEELVVKFDERFCAVFSQMRNGHGISLGSDGVGGVRNVTFRRIFINGVENAV